MCEARRKLSARALDAVQCDGEAVPQRTARSQIRSVMFVCFFRDVIDIEGDKHGVRISDWKTVGKCE